MRGDVYDIMCNNIKYILEDKVRGRVKTLYAKDYDTLIVEIYPDYITDKFRTSYKCITYSIMHGSNSTDLADSVLRLYKNWVRKKIFI